MAMRQTGFNYTVQALRSGARLFAIMFGAKVQIAAPETAWISI
jgi:hypothetical protein